MTQKLSPPKRQQKKKSIPPYPWGKKVVKPSTTMKEMDADEEERMEQFKEVDYSEYFITNETFKSKEELRDWAKSRAQAHNMFLIVGSSRQQKILLQCERSGKYRPTKLNIDVESQKFTGSKKCLCPFNLKGWQERRGVWRLCVMNGKHNHRPTVYHCGYSLVTKLNEEHYEITAKLTISDVKPKEILDHLRQQNPNVKTTLKHIYNAKSKIKAEAMGGRTIVQQLMPCIQEHNYTQWHRVDAVTNEVTDVMFAHSQSIRLLRLFPYVLLIDSTHKTNRYKVTLLEIIGVTPVGKHFNVAFAFMTNESEESYRWALMNLRSLFEENVRPNVIVTDRELELIKALELVDSRSVEEYEANYSDMLQQYQDHQVMLRYLEETWLIYKEKFVCAWTDKVFHIGSTTVKRVESVHSVLEKCLGSSTVGFDTIWTQIHSEVEGHINGIQIDLAISGRMQKHQISHSCIENLASYVIYEALNKLYQEHTLGRDSKAGTDPQSCGCYLRLTHGLHCAHEMALKEQENGMFFTDDVHVFWRTQSLEGSPPINDDPDHRGEHLARLDSMFEELKRRSSKEQRVILHAIHSFLYPEEFDLDKRLVMQPMSRSQSTHGLLSSGKGSPGSAGRHLSGGGCTFERDCGKSSSSPAPTKYSSAFPPCGNELSSFLVPYITSWLNVASDGNCGYRVVADIIYGSEEKWMDVRRDLYREITHHFELYKQIFGSENATRTVLLSLCHWENGMAPRDTWMTLLDMGLVIATRYNAVVLELSATQNVTYLPLCDDNGTGQISCSIPICYLPADEHYVLLNLQDQCPLPPIYQQWSRFRDNSVAYLDNAFTARRVFWDFLRARG